MVAFKLKQLRDSTAPKKITLLLGSALTGYDKGVPGVEAMTRVVRDALAEFDCSFDLPQASQSGQASENYCSLYELAIRRLGPVAADNLLAKGILESGVYRGPRFKNAFYMDDDDKLDMEKREADWNISDSLLSIARMTLDYGTLFSNRILTPNFDPLLEIAFRRCGATPITINGALDTPLPINGVEDGPLIVHLHGFWRSTDQLHTRHQLLRTRPKVGERIREIIQATEVAVFGYGGWEDVFMKTYIEQVLQLDKRPQLIWATFSDKRPEALPKELEDEFQLNTYPGIDIHRFFPSLEATLRRDYPLDSSEEEQDSFFASCGNDDVSCKGLNFNLATIWGLDRGNLLGVLEGGKPETIARILNATESELSRAVQEGALNLPCLDDQWQVETLPTRWSGAARPRLDEIIHLTKIIIHFPRDLIASQKNYELQRMCRELAEWIGLRERRESKIILSFELGASRLVEMLKRLPQLAGRVDHFRAAPEQPDRIQCPTVSETTEMTNGEGAEALSSAPGHKNSFLAAAVDPVRLAEWLTQHQTYFCSPIPPEWTSRPGAEGRPVWCTLAVAYCHILFRDGADGPISQMANDWLQQQLSGRGRDAGAESSQHICFSDLTQLYALCCSKNAINFKALVGSGELNPTDMTQKFTADLVAVGLINDGSLEVLDTIGIEQAYVWWHLARLKIQRHWLKKLLNRSTENLAARAVFGLIESAEYLELRKDHLTFSRIKEARRNRKLYFPDTFQKTANRNPVKFAVDRDDC
ncbi:SIR2 family protein [Rhodobium gokarnense]|uniref:SIR2-like domain-containing protein n=1 Tax=Rhodobium gokarnense TaxID=364296 RepID=A0ABT3HEP9_9HYPH|nr:SIR2 family protein [Rhodobium gokarnense]MCW2308874.1 hypothetical protein [Rhodobium gokarnense]